MSSRVGHKIYQVEEGSIAWEMEIEAGDLLLSVNGNEILDIFDYHFLVHDEYIELLIQKEDGEQWELEIEKEYEEDLGIQFENGLMDEYRSCTNKCVFCFIDQMPPGMRETLYFKDDDARLSFLQGNYITLTNMKEADLDRIIRYHMSPINISVHTTNPKLRCRMLHNRFAGEALDKIKRLYDAGITMNGQIVLCKGYNDKEELERSIRELAAYLPHMQSVSVVPIGMTKYREGLAPVEPFTKEDAREVLETIHRWQEILYQQHGVHFIHGGDEWYLLAGYPIPQEPCYDGYLQLENGVGMLRLLIDEVTAELADLPGDEREAEISIGTGKAAYETIRMLCTRINEKYPHIKIQIYGIENQFFGEQITVSGLLTGQDIAAQLTGRKLGSRLLLPENVLRSGEAVFLDDMTVQELENTLQVSVDIVQSSGKEFVACILGGGDLPVRSL